MIFSTIRRKTQFTRFVAILGLLAFWQTAARGQEERSRNELGGTEKTLVRVNIVKSFTESSGAGEAVMLNGQPIYNYHPRIIQTFPSTGVVIDDKGHVLTFLGYRWVDVEGGEVRVNILTSEGDKLPGKMIGIDQSTGVAVLRALKGKMEKTPLCLGCEVRDGATVVMLDPEALGPMQFQSAQIMSVGTGGETVEGGWVVTVNRRLPGVGEPLLDAKHRVLGFIAGQQPSPQDPIGMYTVIYPMTQVMTSAEKILQAGGDIRTGWLGVFVDYPPDSSGPGVKISSVLEGSPAEKAGLTAQDVVVKWNGTPIQDARQFIRRVQDTPIGTKVELGIVRQGNPVTVAAVIDTRKPEETPGTFILKIPEEIPFPNSSFQGEITFLKTMKPTVRPEPPRIGVGIVALTPQLADFLRVRVRSGLLVSAVEAKRPAALAGVEVGDVILSIDGRSMQDPQAFSSHIQSSGWGSTVVLKLLRKGIERTASILLKKPASPAAEPSSKR